MDQHDAAPEEEWSAPHGAGQDAPGSAPNESVQAFGSIEEQEQTPKKRTTTRNLRRRQELTAALFAAVLKGSGPAPLDETLEKIRILADEGILDRDTSLLRADLATARALRGRKAGARLRELGIGKSGVAALRAIAESSRKPSTAATSEPNDEAESDGQDD